MPETEPEHAHHDKRPRVVVADDDPVVRAALSAQLAAEYDVVGLATDAAEAIALTVEQRPDLAILDVDMPEGGGLRATREIRGAVPTTTVVALSADESDEVVRDMILAGAVNYIRKGMKSDELGEALRASLAARPFHGDAS
jgi:DNA-binding NarL/FixJ family response regulator